MTKIINSVLVLAAAVIVAGALYFWSTQTNQAHGSVGVTSEYHATSTAASSVYGATITGRTLIKSGQGVLGQVTITGANTGVFHLYDATTTNVSLRTGQKATSTILIASFPASAAAGTYVFDARFNDGLLLDTDATTLATSTITYRNQ